MTPSKSPLYLTSAAPGAPAVRGGVVIDGFKVLLSLPEKDLILASMCSETAALLPKSSRNDWLPVEVDLEMMRAVASVKGLAGTRALGLQSVHASIKTPLLGPFVQGVAALFRLNPEKVVRMIKSVLASMYRDVGIFAAVESHSEKRAVLTWREVPPFLLEDAAHPWLAGFSGGFEIAFELCNVEGTIEVVHLSPEVDGIDFVFSWEAQKEK